MFSIPSFDKLFANASQTLKRFPFVLLVAVFGTYCVIQFIIHDGNLGNNITFFSKSIIVSLLALPLTIALAIMSERGVLPLPSWAAQGLGVLAAAAYYFILPKIQDLPEINYWTIQIIVFNIAFHLLVAYVPYLRKLNINGFWQYNKTLFLAILTSLLYSFVLWGGLCLAISAINALFDVKISYKWFGYLFASLIGVFNTWMFLSKIPQNFDALDNDTTYPKGLKLFSQYVLLPLVSVYLVILYAYILKIVMQWSLPIGWVSYLVIGFSVAGMLCFLLLYPFGEYERQSWIARFNRLFYILIIPLIIMLFVAIGYRVMEYGITENRYYVLLSAIWLLSMAIYFNISKRDNIAVIPITLSIIAFLSAFGPWGASSLSESSQYNRLKNYFIKNEILKNGKVNLKHKTVSEEDRKEITEIVRYFENRKNLTALSSLFDDGTQSFIQRYDTMSNARKYSNAMNPIDTILTSVNVTPSYSYNYTPQPIIDLSLTRENRDFGINITGYRIYQKCYFNGNAGESVVKIAVDNDKGEIAYLEDGKKLSIKLNDKTHIFDLQPYHKSIYDTYKMKNSDNNLIPKDKEFVVLT
ncbi:MAG: DUF4153 domain-containing protein, partial [Saprospiraceae bacterium]|nr:DUF4153 domain-containing protein [Saprospiraceae bacterium]